MIMSYPCAAAQPLLLEFPVNEFLYWFALNFFYTRKQEVEGRPYAARGRTVFSI